MTAEQPYDVVAEHDGLEVRRYPEHLVAEVQVNGNFDSVGNAAFSALFGYITGENESRDSIAMTAPVVQQQVSPGPGEPAESDGSPESIAMTAPVTHTETGGGQFVVAFVLPAAMTADTAPTPTNPSVRIRVVPQCFAAAQLLHHLVQHRRCAIADPFSRASLDSTPAGVGCCG